MREKTLVLRNSPLPMAISPASSSALCRKSLFVLSARATSSCALRLSSMPASVRMMLWLLRTKSLTPSSSSSCMIWRDRVGCVT